MTKRQHEKHGIIDYHVLQCRNKKAPTKVTDNFSKPVQGYRHGM